MMKTSARAGWRWALNNPAQESPPPKSTYGQYEAACNFRSAYAASMPPIVRNSQRGATGRSGSG